MFPQQPAPHQPSQPAQQWAPQQPPQPTQQWQPQPAQQWVPHQSQQPAQQWVPQPAPQSVPQPVPQWTPQPALQPAPQWTPQPVPPAMNGAAPPPPAPGRRTFRILVAVAALLAVAIAATAVPGWSQVADLRHGVSSRQAERDRTTSQEQAAVRKQLDDFRAAGLDTLLQRVKDLDQAADVAFRSWRAGTARFGVLDTAMNDCDDAVITYNTAAGPFPEHLFTALPRQINLDNPETDCGRAFTASI